MLRLSGFELYSRWVPLKAEKEEAEKSSMCHKTWFRFLSTA